MSSSPKSNQPSISSCINQFGLKLLQLEDNQSNVFQSPLSIAAALTMLMNGADGETFKEIRSMLGYTEELQKINEEWSSLLKTVVENNSNNIVAIGNKLLAKPGIKVRDQFKSRLKSFDADIDLNKDDIVNRVNEWVKERTRGMITNMIDDEINVVLAILNAVYFQGAWQNPFNKKYTSESYFYNFGTTKTKVSMMTAGNFFTNYVDVKESSGFRMLELPYERGEEKTGPKFKMLILLPNSKTGLPELIKNLSIDKLNKYMKDMDIWEVDIELPRFTIKTKYDLNKRLQELGMTRSFDQQSADFSGITGHKDLFVSAALHKAAIEVDEKGTTASAATGISTAISFHQEFTADHPFLFFIIDDTTGVMLFAGTVNNL